MATTRLSLRSQASCSGSARQKGSLSAAARGRLRHLRAVATWASAYVPPLGAFLGSRLASASQILGSPPAPSPHFTCQRCESILQVGINCSVRVRSRKRKKRSLVSKEASTPLNSIFYYCNYCLFENMKLGTPKTYVKTKLKEVAARDKLSELSKGLGEKDKRTSKNEVASATQVFSMQSAGSSGKRQKRKGWLSLKQLTGSSVDLSPSPSSRPVLIKSGLIPQMKILDSPKFGPKISQGDIISMTPSSMKGALDKKMGYGNLVAHSCSFADQFPLGVTTANMELEPCNNSAADIGSKNISNLIASHTGPVILEHCVTFTTDKVCFSSSPSWHQTGIAALSSQCDAKCVGPNDKNGERQPTNAMDSSSKLIQHDTFAVPLELAKKEQLSCHQSDAECITVDQLTSCISVSKHDKLTSAAVSQKDTIIVAPTMSVQGEMICKDANLSPSSVNTLPNGDSLDKPMDGLALKPLQSPLKEKEGVLMSEMFVEPGGSLFSLKENLIKRENKEERSGLAQLKRKLKEHDNWHKIAKKQKPVTCNDLQYEENLSKESRDRALGNEADSKKQPVFRRMGRHWFTKSRSRIFKWRII